MMPSELFALRTLFWSDERSRCSSHEFAVGTSFVVAVALFLVGVISLPSGLLSLFVLGGAVAMALYGLRASFRRDAYYRALFETVTERLQDEVFLRFQVVPARQIRVGDETDFVTVDNRTVRGIITLAERTPRFAVVQNSPVL